MEKTHKIKKVFCLVAMLTIITVVFFGLTNPAFSASPKVYKWRMQTMSPPVMINASIVLPAFCERVRKMSNGRLEISLYTAGQLVPTLEVVNALKTGMIDLAYTAGPLYLGTIPEARLESTALPPMVLRDSNDIIELYRYRGLNEIFRETYAKHGVYFVDNMIVGSPATHWSKRPLHSIADLKGYKIRTFGYLGTVFKKLGATPTFIPHAEVYTALAQGIIDGSSTDSMHYKLMKYYEVAPYFYLPPWIQIGASSILASLKSWNDLPEDLKAIVHEATIVASNDQHHRTSMGYQQMLKEFKKFGVTKITWPQEEIQKIRDASIPLLDDIAKKSPGCAKGIGVIKDYMKMKGYIK